MKNRLERNVTREEFKAVEALSKVALPYLEEALADPDSLDILAIKIAAAPDKPEGCHMVKIEYSSVNDMGEREKDALYIETEKDRIFGNEVALDVDRVIDHLEIL